MIDNGVSTCSYTNIGQIQAVETNQL